MRKLTGIFTTIAFISFIVFVIQKILNGQAYEKYRTFWLYEINYFSVGLILIVGVLSPIVYYFIYKVNKAKTSKEEDELKKQLLKRRQEKNSENAKYNKSDEPIKNLLADS